MKQVVTSTFIIGAIVIGLSVMVGRASAQVPPDQMPSLTPAWQEWALSIPASVNPVTDLNGDDCMVGQRGPIWFLAGNPPGASPVARTCSVPADKTLFFPVVNAISFSLP